MTLTPGLYHYLIIGALLFCFGLTAVLTRRNGIAVLMGIELILNAANINFVAFSNYVTHALGGHVFVVFVILLAAIEAAVALAIVFAIYRHFHSVEVPQVHEMQG
jgi:NADH:ubiquinone oxidoreductase subunit K